MVIEMYKEICSLLEAWIVIEFITRILKFKKEGHKRDGIKYLMVIITYSIMHFNGYFPFSHIILFSAVILITMLYCVLFLQQKTIIQIFWMLIPQLLVSIINIFMLQVLNLAQDLGFSGKGYLILYNILLLGSKLLLGCVLYFIYKGMLDRRSVLEKNEYRIFIVLLASLLLIEVGIFYLMSIMKNVGADIILLGISMMLFIVDIVTTNIIHHVHLEKEERLRSERLNLQNKELERKIKGMERQQDRIRRLKHDYQNHLMIINHLLKRAEYKEVLSYTDGLNKLYLNEYPDEINISNPSIQAIINEKRFFCRENDIDFQISIMGDLSHLKGMEINIILLNLLDNAKEAVLKKEKKLIQTELVLEGGFFYIGVKNSIEKSVLAANPQLLSHKGKGHGYGWKNILEAMERLGGQKDIYEKDGMFCVNIILPRHLVEKGVTN